MASLAAAQGIEDRLDRLRDEHARLGQARGVNREPLPEWAIEALVAAGMTRREIETYEAEDPLTDEALDAEIDAVEAAAEALEADLLAPGPLTLSELADLGEVALARLRRALPTDPDDLFYDADNPRAMALVTRLVEGLRAFEATPLRRVS